MTPARTPRKRDYNQTGTHTVRKALPFLVERIADERVPDADLAPIESAVREWRREVLTDLGGTVPATKRALLDAATGTRLILSSLDAYLFKLASEDGLVNRRSRRAFAIVADRQRVADSLTKQLTAIGYERAAPRVPTIAEYLASRTAAQEGAGDEEDEDDDSPDGDAPEVPSEADDEDDAGAVADVEDS